jgi:NADPH:quinone reductase-like Zn-dependent oxidoreductase
MNKEHYTGLERLAEHANDGALASFMDQPYPLHRTAAAVGHLEAGRARGKVVITV